MKLVTYTHSKSSQLGIIHDGKIWPLKELDAAFPDKMRKFLFAGEAMMEKAKKWDEQIKAGNVTKPFVLEKDVVLEAPVPQPTSCRDGYAFRQHVAAARRNRGVEMIKEFDQYPIFYFTNHNAIQGPGVIDCMPDHFEKLDFELEAAIVIGKKRPQH